MLSKSRKFVLICSIVILAAISSSLVFARHADRLNSRFALCVAAGVLILGMIGLSWKMLHKEINLRMVLRYGDNKLMLVVTLVLLVLVVQSACEILPRYQGRDDYASKVTEFIGCESGGLEYLPYLWNEEHLSNMVRKDAVDQLESFIHDPNVVLYEYPTSGDTRYWKLSELCVMLNELMQNLNSEDRDGLGAMQKVFAATDAIELADYEPDFSPVAILLLEAGMMWAAIIAVTNLLQWFCVARYIKVNGGIERVLRQILDESEGEEGQEWKK